MDCFFPHAREVRDDVNTYDMIRSVFVCLFCSHVYVYV